MQIDQTMEAQKNTRRKRKDHESRDFTCRCGKSYLSYAAAYTHVKNKHELEKQFLDDIGKPERQKLPRGRPKQKKQAQSSVEIQQLSIIEEAILKIYQLLQNKFEKVILEGNSKQRGDEIESFFQNLLERREGLNVRVSEETERFIRDLNKHFSAQISGRIKLAVVTISRLLSEEGSQNEEVKKKIVSQLNSLDLWKGENQINMFIYDSFVKWLTLSTP